MSIEGLFLICLIIGVAILATVAVVILAFLLYSTRDMVDALKKDINLLETQNARIKDRLLKLEIQRKQEFRRLKNAIQHREKENQNSNNLH